MKIIKDVICTQCQNKQVSDLPELLQERLFWRTCEFCRRYGLKVIVKKKFTIREWMEAVYATMGLPIMEMEAFLKKQ